MVYVDKMPSSCYECKFRQAITGLCELIAEHGQIATYVKDYREERYENCPLKELVKCKNCKHFHHGFTCDLLQKPALADSNSYYCANGERKEEQQKGDRYE